MATEVNLPALGESVTEGTVTQWLKSVGDEVAVDEPLLEVSTDKVDTEIPSPVAGTLLEIRADQDETVDVGAVLAVIGDAEESAGTSDQDGSGDAQAGASAATDTTSAPADQSDEQQQTPTSGAEQETRPSSAAAPSDSPDREEPAEDQSAATDEGANEQPPSEQEPASQAEAQPSGSSEEGGSESTDVKLPALGESVTEGTVTQWLKSVGDEVSVDEPLLEVSTDKVDTEIPSPVAGKLLEITVDADETVEVGAVLGRIGSDGAAAGRESEPQAAGSGGAQPPSAAQETARADEPAASAPPEDRSAKPAPEAAEPARAKPDRAQPEGEPSQVELAAPTESADHAAASAVDSERRSADGQRQQDTGGEADSHSYVTPLVRKLAAQHNVELSSLTGTGVGGRVRKQDVLAAAEAAERDAQTPAEAPTAQAEAAAPIAAGAGPASQLRGKTEKLSRLRKVIAARMVESLQVSAQLTTVVEVDVTAISRLRDRVKAGFEQREGVKLSFLPFFAKAAIDALKTYPQVNASIDTEAGEVTYHDGEHLGVAVDTERGLLVPVIKDAGDLSIAGLARKIADLAVRTRDSKISPDELSGGTFTLTNTGSRGALFDTPIINQPQVGILGTGTVVKRPVVIDDPNLGETIAVRQMVYLALTYDHRLVDGADAARFLTAIKQRLEEANFESELGV
ncbi:MAG: 2-oxoglutarate dehydrogenase, E2 component, dihydrolipoamide succinyltransferase [Nocardioidaceae bacterium]